MKLFSQYKGTLFLAFTKSQFVGILKHLLVQMRKKE